jgi:hypothetical protein
MASNYDPNHNRLKHIRYNTGPNYVDMKLEKPENVLNKYEFYQLHILSVPEKRKAFVGLVAGLITQFALGRWSGFKCLNGYVRTGVRSGVGLLPFLVLNELGERKVEQKYDEYILDKLKLHYENPISHKYLV